VAGLWAFLARRQAEVSLFRAAHILYIPVPVRRLLERARARV